MSPADMFNAQVTQLKPRPAHAVKWEACFDAYFDFYLDARYFGKPLLKFDDIGVHLYLRNTLSAENANRPRLTIGQISQQVGMSAAKMAASLGRLEQAQLLTQNSGGLADGAHGPPTYTLSDPLTTLAEFIAAAQEGRFGLPLRAEYATNT